MSEGYQIKEHTADVIVKARGKTLAELFQQAALGMMAVLKPEVDSSKAVNREIKVESTDQNSLLVDFLNELLYQMDVNQESYSQFDVQTAENAQALKAKVTGHSLVKFGTEIKAATYHNLEVKKVNDYFETEITFDI
jgi:SHS2 domain-containing protein